MKADLKDQVALVTGAARGIGLATARLLAENGARVVVADIDEAEAGRVAAGMPGATAWRMDVSSAEEVAAGVRELTQRLGRIDILVNNAGINTLRHRVTIDQFPIEEWDRIMAVDLRGVFLVSRAVSAVMIAQGGGRIVNIASVLGIVPARLQCAYTAAKAGVINLTQTMAIELAPQKISVNCVAPGSTLTAATEQLFYGTDAVMQEKSQRIISHIPAGRPGKAEEVAQAVLFFAAPETSYITGQIVSVDGGWSAGGFLRDF
ncbi:MAG: SDR family oxidoreductase [Opitutaceae bacterium]|jgi:3-oxoacyl-[acyl-carrier protein] reductase|nr:SDR family oxidoreductase [Opitutaceae bacterium]MBP9913128.1 SDR family oxidoreductase [Opitutaceae bacterium]